MVDRIKKYQESVFENMPEGTGPADQEFITTSKTGIPITKAQEIIANRLVFANYYQGYNILKQNIEILNTLKQNNTYYKYT